MSRVHARSAAWTTLRPAKRSWPNDTSPCDDKSPRPVTRFGTCSRISRTWRTTGVASKPLDPSETKPEVWVRAARWTSRRCTLVETVTAWEEGRAIATTNQPSALVPFKQADSRVTLEPDGDGTAITFDYRYVPRGGPMGRLTGPVIDTMLRRSFESMLASIEEAALNAG